MIDNALKDVEGKNNEDDFVFPFVLDDTESSDTRKNLQRSLIEPLFEEDIEPETQEDEGVIPPEQEETSTESIDTSTTETDRKQLGRYHFVSSR